MVNFRYFLKHAGTGGAYYRLQLHAKGCDPGIVGGNTLNGAGAEYLKVLAAEVDSGTTACAAWTLAQEARVAFRAYQNNSETASQLRVAWRGLLIALFPYSDHLPADAQRAVGAEQCRANPAEACVTLATPWGVTLVGVSRQAQAAAWWPFVKGAGCMTGACAPTYIAGTGVVSDRRVKVSAFPLYDADGFFWGAEVYATFPKPSEKTYGFEVRLRSDHAPVFSLVRADCSPGPARRGASEVRQGDALFVRQRDSEDEEPWTGENAVVEEYTLNCLGVDPWGWDRLLGSVTWDGDVTKWTAARRGWQSLVSVGGGGVLAKHPDHPSVFLSEGIWLVKQVPGRTDYEPQNRGGD